MYDELTREDIRKMQEEIDYRVQVLRPKLIEDVQTARAFGDLSENFEYKVAKQEKNRNDSRVRYLQRMIKTARVIEDRSGTDTAEGSHQQGVPGGQGSHGPPGRRPGGGAHGERQDLLRPDPVH